MNTVELSSKQSKSSKKWENPTNWWPYLPV